MPDRNGARAGMIALGQIVNTHGILGELRLLPYNPDSEAFRPGIQLTLRRGGTQRDLQLRSTRRHRSFVLVTFASIDSMSEAEELVGSEVEIAASALPVPAEGEVYHFQLLGLTVFTTNGEELGIVDEVFTTAANDVVVVRRDGRELLIPYVDDVVRRVDLDAGQIVIEPLPGLLEP